MRLLLWTPQAHRRFPADFRALARSLLLCRASEIVNGYSKIGLGALPAEALYYARGRRGGPKESPGGAARP